MKPPSLVKHLRDILILPFTVTVIVPYFIFKKYSGAFIPDHPAIKITGAIILLAALSLFIYTVSLFKSIAQGTLAPWSVKQKLVLVGPYRYCRNPMITGVFFILIGESLFFHHHIIAIWAAVFLLINTIYFIAKEEPDLEKQFGDDYRAYKKEVPRWLPNIKPYRNS